MTRSLFVVGAFPPPVNGYALVTAAFAEQARSARTVACFDTSPGGIERGMAYHWRRSTRLAHALAAILATPPAERGGLYCAVESGLGLLYTVVLCIAGRLLNLPVLLHHHSFRYIDRRSGLMALVVRLSGKQVTHIFLCGCMEEKFRRAYPRRIATRVLSNVGFLPEPGAMAFDEARPLTVGFLSNLTAEKGLYRFLEVARRSCGSGIDIRFVLAGPAAGKEEADAIAQCVHALGDRLDYRGGVYGEQKAQFYRDTDVFLFPSLYRNEAQPLVLFEAMLSGCPVIAIDRGCIAEQVGANGLVVGAGDDFATRAVEHLHALVGERDALNTHRRSIAATTRAAAAKARAEALALARSP